MKPRSRSKLVNILALSGVVVSIVIALYGMVVHVSARGISVNVALTVAATLAMYHAYRSILLGFVLAAIVHLVELRTSKPNSRP